jgi:hypothetical protein
MTLSITMLIRKKELKLLKANNIAYAQVLKTTAELNKHSRSLSYLFTNTLNNKSNNKY